MNRFIIAGIGLYLSLLPAAAADNLPPVSEKPEIQNVFLSLNKQDGKPTAQFECIVPVESVSGLLGAESRNNSVYATFTLLSGDSLLVNSKKVERTMAEIESGDFKAYRAKDVFNALYREGLPERDPLVNMSESERGAWQAFRQLATGMMQTIAPQDNRLFLINLEMDLLVFADTGKGANMNERALRCQRVK